MKRLFSLILLVIFLLVIGVPAKAAAVTQFLAAPPNVPAWNTGDCVTTLVDNYALPATAPQSCVSSNFSKVTIITTSLTPPPSAPYTKVTVNTTIGSGYVTIWDQDGIQYFLVNETGIDTDDPVPNSVTISGKTITGFIIQSYCAGCGVDGLIVSVDVSYPAATPTRTATITRTPTRTKTPTSTPTEPPTFVP